MISLTRLRLIAAFLLLGSSMVLAAPKIDETGSGQASEDQINEQQDGAYTNAENDISETSSHPKPASSSASGSEDSGAKPASSSASGSDDSGQNDQLQAQADQGSTGAQQALKARQASKPAPASNPVQASPLSSVSSVGKSSGDKTIQLQKITVRQKDFGVKVYIALSAPTQFFSFFRKSPPSVFVQFLSSGVTATGGPVDNVGVGPIDQIAYGYDVLAMGLPGGKARLRYLEIRLNKPVAHYAEQNGSLVTLNLVEAGEGETAPGTASFETDKYKGELSLPDKPATEDLLRVAEGNSKPLVLARKGVELARFQVFEAARPLYPAATLKASQTTGDDANPLATGVTGTFLTTGFRQEEFGVQVAQPIYQSRKLIAAYERAKVNEQVAGELIRKQIGEIDFEVQRAYYDVLKTQTTLRLHRELLAEASQIRDLTIKKQALKLTSQIDALNVETQYNQVAFQVAASEQEVALSRLNLSAVLNQPQPLPDIVPGKLTPRHIQVNIDTLLAWAVANRPDLKIAKKNVDLAQKSWQIAKGEDGFRVDVSGFIGKAGAAFTDEPLVLTTAWNVGVKASVPFRGNTVSVNHTDEKTAPDLSQSFVTTVHSNSLNIGILDALPAKSKEEQARLNYEKSEADYTEALQRAEYEVRDAYFNLVKLSHQLESNEHDVEFHRKQLAVTRERNNLGLVENAQLLSELMSYVQAEATFQETMAASNTAMVTLDKAIGIRMAR